MLIGVTLPVSSSSTRTFAPDGNEVTFNEPFCAPALLGISKSPAVNAAMQTTLAIQTTLLGWFIESSLNACHAQLLCANLTRVVDWGNAQVKLGQLPLHSCHRA